MRERVSERRKEDFNSRKSPSHDFQFKPFPLLASVSVPISFKGWKTRGREEKQEREREREQ